MSKGWYGWEIYTFPIARTTTGSGSNIYMYPVLNVPTPVQNAYEEDDEVTGEDEGME